MPARSHWRFAGLCSGADRACLPDAQSSRNYRDALDALIIFVVVAKLATFELGLEERLNTASASSHTRDAPPFITTDQACIVVDAWGEWGEHRPPKATPLVPRLVRSILTFNTSSLEPLWVFHDCSHSEDEEQQADDVCL